MPVLLHLICMYSSIKYWWNIYRVTGNRSACRKQSEAPSGSGETNNEVCADGGLL